METEYFKRKIDKQLLFWSKKKNHSPAIVYGVRQCGKSKSILHFANENYKYVNPVDFWKTPSAKGAFNGSLEVDEITKSLSAIFPSFRFVPHETVLVFDEIQDCPRARLAFKSFKEDGRFDVIASGSYLGLNIDNSAEPKPNGSEDFFEMKTMDFEEYLWARGYGDETIQGILEYFEKRTPVPEIIHNQMKKLFNEYICVGGYPEAILNFFQTNNYYEAFKKTRSLVIDIKGDASKRLSEDKKPLYAPGEVARIQKSFELIASFIVEDNKRYVMSKIGGNSYQRDDAINYLLNACVAFKANNVEVPSLPLGVKKISSDFKLFYADIGILINELGFDVVQSIQNDDEMGMNKGYLYEAVVADSLYKANIPLYYYAKSGKFEIDLVISYRGHSTLVEAKAKSGNTKSSKTVLKNPGLYGETKLIKIGNYNVGEEGDVLTIPHYLAFALGKHNNEEVTQ